jgi:hypothetical protein
MTHRDWLTLEGRIVALLDRRVESVHVDVNDLANSPFVHLGRLTRVSRHPQSNRSRPATMIRTSVPQGRTAMPKKKTPVRSPWTKDDIRQLKAYSKARTPVVEVAKAMKRTEAAVRQKAKTIEIGLGHRR